MQWPNAPSTGYIADVADAFLRQRKVLTGRPEWVEGNRIGERRAVWPVSIDGLLVGVTLQATAYPNEGELRFTLTLNLPPCIWRLDFEPGYKRHRNPLDRAEALGAFVINGPNYHSWSDNRHLATATKLPENLDCARPLLPSQARTWEQAIRWFCGQTNIALQREQMIELPQREKLL